MLLISRNLYCGFAEDGEVEGRTLRGCIGEYKLVCQCRLPASWRARDDVKRKFGETTAHNLVKARNPGRQFVDRHSTLCAHAFLPFSELQSSRAAPGHVSRSRLAVKPLPRKR